MRHGYQAGDTVPGAFITVDMLVFFLTNVL